LQRHAWIRKAAIAMSVPLTLGALGLLAAYTIQQAATEAKQRTLASAFALDFSLTLPALVYLLLVRTKRAPLLAVVPTFVIGSIIATLAIPRDYDGTLDLLHMLLLPAELGLIAYIVFLARRAYGRETGEGADFVSRFRAAALRTVEVRRAADVLTTEVSIFHYATRLRAPALPDGAFTIHREANYRTLLIGLSIAVVAETVGVHFLVARWSHLAAWILTGLSVYAIVWLLGDFQAMRVRPMRVTKSHLLLRIGVRWEADIPLTNIANVEKTRTIENKRDRATLVAQLCGMTNVRLDFVEPAELTGPYGMRKRVTRAHLQVDDANAFCSRIQSAREA
jgi:hypothetical protein